MTKKRFLSLLLSCIMLLTMIPAGGYAVEEHDCQDYIEGLFRSSTHHWNECTFEGCGEIYDYQPHEYNDNGYCDICEHYRPATAIITHTHIYVMANCREPATCDCGQTVGYRNKNRHVGGTILRGALVVTEFENGYTGDVVCLGCETVLEYGRVVNMLHQHEWGWQYDEEAHWQQCINPECGAEGETAAHTEETPCECGYVRHEHSYADATCAEPATCECGATEGDVDKTNHVGGTEVRDAKEPTTDEEGYTGDTYCNGCGELLLAGEIIPKIHVHSYDGYDFDSEGHWLVCTCGDTLEVEDHNWYIYDRDDSKHYWRCDCGNKGWGDDHFDNNETEKCDACAYDMHLHVFAPATCQTPETCACGETRGEIDPNNHVGKTEIVGVLKAGGDEKGYTGDQICMACGQVVQAGKAYDTFVALTEKLSDGAQVIVKMPVYAADEDTVLRVGEGNMTREEAANEILRILTGESEKQVGTLSPNAADVGYRMTNGSGSFLRDLSGRMVGEWMDADEEYMTDEELEAYTTAFNGQTFIFGDWAEINDKRYMFGKKNELVDMETSETYTLASDGTMTKQTGEATTDDFTDEETMVGVEDEVTSLNDISPLYDGKTGQVAGYMKQSDGKTSRVMIKRPAQDEDAKNLNPVLGGEAAFTIVPKEEIFIGGVQLLPETPYLLTAVFCKDLSLEGAPDEEDVQEELREDEFAQMLEAFYAAVGVDKPSDAVDTSVGAIYESGELTETVEGEGAENETIIAFEGVGSVAGSENDAPENENASVVDLSTALETQDEAGGELLYNVEIRIPVKEFGSTTQLLGVHFPKVTSVAENSEPDSEAVFSREVARYMEYDREVSVNLWVKHFSPFVVYAFTEIEPVEIIPTVLEGITVLEAPAE